MWSISGLCHVIQEAALHSCSYKKVFLKYTEKLRETSMPKYDFDKVELIFRYVQTILLTSRQR